MNTRLVTDLLKDNKSAVDTPTLIWKTTISNSLLTFENPRAMDPDPFFEVLKKIEVVFENPKSIPHPVYRYILERVSRREIVWSVSWLQGSNLLTITPKCPQTDSSCLKSMLASLKKELDETNENIREVNKILEELRLKAETKFQDIVIE